MQQDSNCDIVQCYLYKSLPCSESDVIEVHISCHSGFVLSTVDGVIIRLLLSLGFILAL